MVDASAKRRLWDNLIPLRRSLFGEQLAGVFLPQRISRGPRHPRSRMTRRSRRQAGSVTGTPRCTVSNSCVVTRCSPCTSCPFTRAKAWCQSVGPLVMYRASIASAPAPMELYHMVYKFGGRPAK
jgi:hypothetical protein